MAEKPTCGTCPYWDRRDDLDMDGVAFGLCRRLPMVMSPLIQFTRVVRREDSWQGTWLASGGDDWCGEHPDFPAYLAARRAEARPDSLASLIEELDPTLSQSSSVVSLGFQDYETANRAFEAIEAAVAKVQEARTDGPAV